MSLTPPEGFRHHVPIQVRWGDTDALGHVNNAKYLTDGVEDMIKGHMVTGIVRSFTGALISLCIALGILLAMQLMGVPGI